MRKLLVVIALAGALQAQEVAMGRRRGSGARLEAPYTFEIATPHVKWAKPLAGGPIHLLAVPSVSEGRTLVELAQRVDLDLTTVSIDADWDVNKWTMGFGRDYGARAEKGDLTLLYSYLEAELTGPKKFDVILLQLGHGWERLTPSSREALARRVKEGCGLVLVRPGGELSPLELEKPIPLPSDGSGIVEPEGAESSPWRRTGDHYITRAIPVESFPFPSLQNYPYRASSDATVLVSAASGHPVAAVRTFGKGRVVAFGYRNDGLSWSMPMAARLSVSNQYWEYFYALLGRAVIWAAVRDSGPPDFARAAWDLKNEDGKLVRSGKGPRPKFNLPAGRYFLELHAANDFRIEAIDAGVPEKIEDLKASKDLASEGDSLEVTWKPAKTAAVEVADGLGRVIARASGPGRVSLKLGRPLTHSGWVQVGRQRIPLRFAASNRRWEDYEVIMPWYGPHGWQPWMAALDEQFRRAGITTLASPERNFRLIASAGLHDTFGVYAYRADAYKKRKAAFVETGDKKYLTRDVVLQDPNFDRELRSQLTERLAGLARLKPLAYYLADESSLTSYTDAFDVDWAPAALAGFRVWLRKQYATLDALNASWGSSFTDWEAVVPMTTEEAQKHGNFAPWADHRAYMEREFVGALAKASAIVREIDPGAPASISGTQVPTAHNGVNWYEIDQVVDYLQPYSGGNQDAMHHLFKPGILLSGFTGYGSVGPMLAYQQWQRLFYGHTGASIFWHYTVVNPDLTLSEQGKGMERVFGKLQSGIGRVFMNSTVREDGVAIHFSMASIRGAWITDGKIAARVGGNTSKAFGELQNRRGAWVRELEKQGVQFRFLATPQIEKGELDKYKVLILPYSIALSDAEALAIDRFLERGGIVYADDQTGRMDERCHWRKTALFAGERKNLIRQAPGPVSVSPAFPVEGQFQVTVRNFGGSRLIGLLAREASTVKLPATAKVRYDLLRGGVAGDAVESSSEAPVLLVERAAKIARLELSPALEVSLVEEGGAPVDRSVVHLEVLDPSGKLVRQYSGNVTVQAGHASFQVPFALNDAPGAWRVRARDVISGLTAERTIRR